MRGNMRQSNPKKEPLNLDDAEKLIQILKTQQASNWDLETAIRWKQPIDFDRPLAALDKNAFLFPGLGSEQRLALSHWMGLVICACIYEMEEFLERTKHLSWTSYMNQCPVNPEFENLGEQFFLEEIKHSQAFRRFLTKYCQEAGIDEELLISFLPQIGGTLLGKAVELELHGHGSGFWWLVSIAEQQFLHIYQVLKPHQSSLDPLYYSLHEKHFEEEARHISFPFYMLKYFQTRSHASHWMSGKVAPWISKMALMYAQASNFSLIFLSFEKFKKLKDVKKHHPLFEALSSLEPQIESLSRSKMLWRLFTRTPYFSPLINVKAFPALQKKAKLFGVPEAPLPDVELEETVDY